MFDEKTQQLLKFYVYMLVNPDKNQPFYIGKGTGNRVFDHLNCAISENEESNLKYETIRSIRDKGKEINHVIVRHGLSEEMAYQIEASLIDAFHYAGILLSNLVKGIHSIEKGLMTANELLGLYNAQPLASMASDCVIININRNYKRGTNGDAIYQATKETWTISKSKIDKIKYVLSEYRGLIVEVFSVDKWYPKDRGFGLNSKQYGQIKTGYGFDGQIAPAEIRDLYLNKSIAHLKKRGAANVIRYNIN